MTHSSRAPQPEMIDPEDPRLRSSSYAQAVRFGSRVDTSGQGGWIPGGEIPSSLRTEVAQAFDRVTAVLAPAGAAWGDVVAATSFFVDHATEDVTSVVNEELARRVTSDLPQITHASVPMLGPRMHIEIKVTALINGERSEDERRIETTVHGGWTDDGEIPDDRDAEIVQAFVRLGHSLDEAGVSWTDVIGMDSFHLELNEDVFNVISDQLRTLIPTHRPIWTCVGAESLADPRMRHGFSVVALSPLS